MKRGHSPTPLSDPSATKEDSPSNNNNNNNNNSNDPQLTSTHPHSSTYSNHPEGEKEKEKEREKDDSKEKDKEDEALKELDNIVNAFRWYYYYVMQRMDKSLSSFSSIPQHHRDLVPDFESNIKTIKEAAKKNYEFLVRVLPPKTSDGLAKPLPASESDMDKVKTSLQQIVRDWSGDCASEREKCYGHLIAALNAKFPDIKSRSSVHILVPGAGLCRLAFDIAKQGFMCQANEFSFSMLLIANFILNKNHGIQSHKLYPWLLNFSNNFQTKDQLQEYMIPDVDTSLRDGNLSMCAGDFLEIYSADNDSFDGMATCFFLDTARNVVQYVEHIYNLLKPNGVWVNIGPLLYHYSETPSEDSIDLSYEQMRHVITSMGFTIEEEKYPVAVPYVENRKSMLHTTFDCVFFTAVKRPPSPTKPPSTS